MRLPGIVVAECKREEPVLRKTKFQKKLKIIEFGEQKVGTAKFTDLKSKNEILNSVFGSGKSKNRNIRKLKSENCEMVKQKSGIREI